MRDACVIAAIAALAAAGCRSNNLLLGRVDAVVNGHTVVVTDCYRTTVPAPESVDNTTTRLPPAGMQ